MPIPREFPRPLAARFIPLASLILAIGGCIGQAKSLVGFHDPTDNGDPSLSLELSADPTGPMQGRIVYVSAWGGRRVSIATTSGVFNEKDKPANLTRACLILPQDGLLPLVVVSSSTDGAILYAALIGPRTETTPPLDIDAAVENACTEIDGTSDPDGGAPTGPPLQPNEADILAARVKPIPSADTAPVDAAVVEDANGQ